MNFNYNDGGRSKYFKGIAQDCVVRAVAIAEDLDYKEVYDALNKLLKSYGEKLVRNSGTPKYITRKFIESYGYSWTPVMKIGSGCEMHLREEELDQFEDTTIIASVSKHVCCIKNGVLEDTYDCSRGGSRCVYGYWYKENAE